jgi:hypothetical protein
MGARDALQRRKLAEEGGVVADARLLVGRGRPVALGAGSVVRAKDPLGTVGVYEAARCRGGQAPVQHLQHAALPRDEVLCGDAHRVAERRQHMMVRRQGALAIVVLGDFRILCRHDHARQRSQQARPCPRRPSIEAVEIRQRQMHHVVAEAEQPGNLRDGVHQLRPHPQVLRTSYKAHAQLTPGALRATAY